MSNLDPIALDRELANAHDDVCDWQVRLREEPEFFDDPFRLYRAHLGMNHFEELCDLPESDALREPLLRWTYWLTEQRINHWSLTQTSQLRYRQEYPLETPIKGKSTLHALIEKLLSPGGAQSHYLRALEQHAKASSEALAMLWARKQEIRERFGLERLAPLLPQADLAGELASVVFAEPALGDMKRTSLLVWLEHGSAAKAANAMPARLSEATVADWFREARMLEELPIGSWTLPNPLVPASYLRVLDELGRRFRRAAGPRHQPFVVANDPRQLEAHAMGYCFASLLLNPSFVARHLGLDKKNQIDFRRAIAGSLLADFASRALKVALHPAAMSSAAQLRTNFQELAAEHLGFEPSPNLALVLFRLQDDDAARLLGAARGLELAAQLKEDHNEDWFRNPRAVDQLRSQAQLSPRVALSPEEAKAAVRIALDTLSAPLQ